LFASLEAYLLAYGDVQDEIVEEHLALVAWKPGNKIATQSMRVMNLDFQSRQ
jgi:hypothetical protein